MKIKCLNCGKTVSSPIPEETVVRASIICPECLEKEEQKIIAIKNLLKRIRQSDPQAVQEKWDEVFELLESL